MHMKCDVRQLGFVLMTPEADFQRSHTRPPSKLLRNALRASTGDFVQGCDDGDVFVQHCFAEICRDGDLALDTSWLPCRCGHNPRALQKADEVHRPAREPWLSPLASCTAALPSVSYISMDVREPNCTALRMEHIYGER